METTQSETKLAYRIGKWRIAAVVDKFYDRIQTHETLAAPFREIEDWPSHKDRLTYFWWIALGGAKDRIVNFDVVPKHRRVGFNDSLLEDWLALFREVVHSTLECGLAEAWMERVSFVGRRLLIANQKVASGVGNGDVVASSTILNASVLRAAESMQSVRIAE
jgi:hemoglobin